MSALRSNTFSSNKFRTARLPRYRMAVAGLAIAGTSLLGACSAESLIESGIEKGIESATGAEDINFSEEGGSISFESEGETIELDFGNDGGSIKVTDEEGNESGLDLDLNEQGGSLTVTEDGETQVFDGTVDETGLVVTDDNGEEVIVLGGAEDGTTLELPEWYPSNLPVPANYNVVTESFILGTGLLSGNAAGEPGNVQQAFTAAATNAGWTAVASTDVADIDHVTLSDADGASVVVSFSTEGVEAGQTNITMAVNTVS